MKVTDCTQPKSRLVLIVQDTQQQPRLWAAAGCNEMCLGPRSPRLAKMFEKTIADYEEHKCPDYSTTYGIHYY